MQCRYLEFSKIDAEISVSLNYEINAVATKYLALNLRQNTGIFLQLPWHRLAW